MKILMKSEIFSIKTKFLTNESLLLNFNRDYFSSLKEYITGLQKSFHLEKNTNAISNKEEIQKLDTIKQREITDRGDLFQRKDSSNVKIYFNIGFKYHHSKILSR